VRNKSKGSEKNEKGDSRHERKRALADDIGRENLLNSSQFFSFHNIEADILKILTLALVNGNDGLLLLSDVEEELLVILKSLMILAT
jgi:hypothetical protein